VPSLADEISDSQWMKRLSAAEVHSLHLGELRSLCSELTAHHKVAAVASSPAIDELPLSGTLSSLAASRVEIEQQEEVLRSQMSEAAGEEQHIKDQIATSLSAMELELQAVQEKRASMTAQVLDIRAHQEKLLAQHAELKAKLSSVSEELVATEAAEAELQEREQMLQASRMRVTEQLAQQLQVSRQRGELAQQHREVLASVSVVSEAIEEQLAARVAAMEEGCARRELLEGKERDLGAASLDSEAAQHGELWELIESWHGAIWGPDAVAFPRNPAQCTSIRAAHLRALGIVERTLGLAEQSASAARARLSSSMVLESLFHLGDGANCGNDGGFAEHMSRRAPLYREMQQQLTKNLKRLGELERYAPGIPGAPAKALAAGLAAKTTTPSAAGGG